METTPPLGARASSPPILSDHYRGYLPHWERGEIPQAVTFRLADSLPAALLASWRQELDLLPQAKRSERRQRKIIAALDAGHGCCCLANPEAAEIVQSALRHFADRRYRLHAWCVMPNHVHVMISPLSEGLSAIVHSWKSFTANPINALTGRTGRLWQPEYHDRMIRDDAHFIAALRYIEQNPVTAGLCRRAEDWPFSSARK